jgi:hypothetical protein
MEIYGYYNIKVYEAVIFWACSGLPQVCDRGPTQHLPNAVVEGIAGREAARYLGGSGYFHVQCPVD